LILRFINSPTDLVTSHKAAVEGFLGQALVKTDKATPHSEAATKFHQALQKDTGFGHYSFSWALKRSQISKNLFSF
jgi:hypothetical protein